MNIDNTKGKGKEKDVPVDTNNTSSSNVLTQEMIAGTEVDNTMKPQAFAELANLDEKIINIDTGSPKFDKTIKDTKIKQRDKNLTKPMAIIPNEYSVQSDEIFVDKQLHTTPPGVVAIFPGGLVNPVQSPPIGGRFVQSSNQAQVSMTIGDSDIEAAHEPTLNAFLVNEDLGVFATATLVDRDAEVKIHQHCGKTIMLGSFITAIIIAVAVAVPVLLTRQGSMLPIFPAQSLIPKLNSSCLGVCPEGSVLTLPDHNIPDTQTTCGEVDELAKAGNKNDTICSSVKANIPFCGCEVPLSPSANENTAKPATPSPVFTSSPNKAPLSFSIAPLSGGATHPPIVSFPPILANATFSPSAVVTSAPSIVVTPAPSIVVTPAPIDVVTPAPIDVVTPAPIDVVTPAPSIVVTPAPIDVVTPSPSIVVTPAPSDAKSAPSVIVTPAPSDVVTSAPSDVATSAPSIVVTPAPIDVVTPAPIDVVTSAPSDVATSAPSDIATPAPSVVDTSAPSDAISAPSDVSTSAPSDVATSAPSDVLTPAPSDVLTPAPSDVATPAPSAPSVVATPAPSDVVTPAPSVVVTLAPSDVITPAPSSASFAPSSASFAPSSTL